MAGGHNIDRSERCIFKLPTNNPIGCLITARHMFLNKDGGALKMIAISDSRCSEIKKNEDYRIFLSYLISSTVRGRWQHIYNNRLCRNFSLAVRCKSNQWVPALRCRVLPAYQCHGGSQSFDPSATRKSKLLTSIACSHDRLFTESKS